jgi:excisionase family DNA binding protein
MNYLTVAEYASEKRVSVRTIRAEIKKGRIKAEKIGKEYRIPWENR